MSKTIIKLRAKVITQDNKTRLKFENPRYYEYMVSQFKHDKNVLITIENTRSQRSHQQNAYWHGVCFPILAELTGHTTDEIKEVVKQMYLEPKTIVLCGIEFQIWHTAKLSKYEGVEFTQKLMKLAESLGGKIPTPQEAGYDVAGRNFISPNPKTTMDDETKKVEEAAEEAEIETPIEETSEPEKDENFTEE